MIATTGKATTGVNSITLHSAFHLPIKSGLKSYEYKKSSSDTLHMFRNKFRYLKIFIIDEKAMIGRSNFGHSDLVLKAVM